MSPHVLVPFSDGVEEIELATIVDVLRRAGADVTTAGLKPGPITGRSRMILMPGASLDDALATRGAFDLVVLPGGLPNAHLLRDDPRIVALVQSEAAAGRKVAAICAAPSVLLHAGLLNDVPATSYPGALKGHPANLLRDDPVVVSGNITTSRGPGTAMAFALSLVESLFGAKTAVKIAGDVLADR